MEVRDTFPHVLPNTLPLHLDTWHIDDAHAQITRRISSTQAAPRCPGCDVPARYVHSHYPRTLADPPWSGDGITWRLRVRRLFCRNPACARRIFAERRPGLVAPWAWRTLRLAARFLAIGKTAQAFGLFIPSGCCSKRIRSSREGRMHQHSEMGRMWSKGSMSVVSYRPPSCPLFTVD
jgi:transposase